MNPAPDSSPVLKENTKSDSTLLGLVLRIWFFMSPIVIFFMTLNTFIAPPDTPVFRVFILIVILVLAIVGRYIDILHLKGTTLDNVPATTKDVARYARNLILFGLAAGFFMAWPYLTKS